MVSIYDRAYRESGEELIQELIDIDDYQDILNWHYDIEADEQDMLVQPTCAPH